MGVHVYWVLYFITDNQDIIMEGQVYWVLFSITDHQDSIHTWKARSPLSEVP